ncbi:ExbD/TolR family protein [Sphingomonas sp. CLY1604]|uniref:ExbD/TolR family protein n=1 Tax=Sphingomonas sp. CLY1604 TaxID=3457786 RepID=UPI003FD8C240
MKILLSLLPAAIAAMLIVACSQHDPRACKTPRSYWQEPYKFGGIEPIMSVVALTHGGTIYWNGTAVSRAQLNEYLKISHGLNPEPHIFLETEMGVSCEALEAVRDQIDRQLDCRKPYSRCSEGIRSVWGNLPSPPGGPVW